MVFLEKNIVDLMSPLSFIVILNLRMQNTAKVIFISNNKNRNTNFLCKKLN